MSAHSFGKVAGMAAASLFLSFGLVSIAAAQTQNKKTADAKKSTPHTAYERPDLNGVWVPAPAGNGGTIIYRKTGNLTEELIGGDPNAKPAVNPNDPDDNFGRLRAAQYFSDNAHANEPKYKPEFQAKVAYLDHNSNTMYPGFYCVPRGVPGVGAPTQIAQFSDHLIFLYGGTMTFRLIPIDKPHNADADASLLGDSVAHWDGNTLVVDVTNFDDLQWLGSSGWFHTPDMHVIERFTRDGDTLTYQVSVDDTVLAEPWVRTRRLKLSTKDEDSPAEEGPCLEKDASHLVNRDHD